MFDVRKSKMKKTSAYLREKKSNGQRISMLTCYDYPTAVWEEEACVDVIFVGDSVGTNMLGYKDEKEVTMADILHHLKAVRNGVKDAYLLADLPYNTCETCSQAQENAQLLISQGADGVKLEGFKPDIISHLVANRIEVCAHLGLNPQIHEKKGLQAKTADAAVELVEQSILLEKAGAFLIVFELVPEEVAREITRQLSIPTIGIGAGRYTDGQVLIITDMLGINPFELKHNKRYETFRERAIEAIRSYANEIQKGEFPAEENLRHLAEEEIANFKARIRFSEPSN